MTTESASFVRSATADVVSPSAVLRFLALAVLFLPSAALANVAPIVDSLTASSTTVLPGDIVSLQLDGHDPDCPDVCDGAAGCGLYIRADLPHWSADGGTFENTDDGVSGSPFTSTTEWRAPTAEGLYTITATLSDSGSFLCDGRQTTTQDIQIQVTLVQNEAPVVESVTADPTLLYPGETSALACVASDPENDPLTYQWSADSGTVEPGAAGSAVFTADLPGAAEVTCTVTDASGAPASGKVIISVVGAEAEKWLDRGLIHPQRIGADSTGSLFVVDGPSGTITVLDLFSGDVLYRIPDAGATSIDVDWNDNLLVGLRSGVQIWNRAGDPMLTLASAPGDVVDVAVDHANRRYGALDRRSSKVTIYDELGTRLASFGSSGDGADQCRSPHGLATTPAGGYWADTHWVVADTGHGMVKIYDGTGSLTSSFGESGGGVGEFVHLLDVEVGPDDVIYGTDSFQSWIQTFNPDGTVRETLGQYGSGLGQFITPAGVTMVEGYDRLVAASVNSSRLQVYMTARDPVAQGPAPVPVIDPFLAFLVQEVGTSSAPLSVQLRNDGGAPFGIPSISINGDFSWTGDCGDFLDPLRSCTLDVVFTPTATGPRSGELRVATTATAAPLVVALSGTGAQSPTLMLVPDSLSFAEQTVGTASPAQGVTVANAGPGPVSLFGIQLTAPYVGAHDCPATLAEGATCTVSVQFFPQTAGASFPGALTVDSSALGSPHQALLDGISVQAGIDVVDASVNEGDAEAVDAVFEVILGGPSDGTVSVDYLAASGTAIEGEDFEPTSGTLWFAQGQDRGTITVPVLPDTALEPDEETFTVTLSNAQGAVIGDGTAVGTILDNEVCAGPNLLSNPGAEEPAGGTGIPGWVEVSGFDWHPAGEPPSPWEGEAYFFAGQSAAAELEQVVDISAFNDLILDGDQLFEFEGYLRGSDEMPADGARIVVEYLHAVDGTVLDSFDSGEIVDSSGWQRVHDVRAAPVDTGWIRVRLLATRYSGGSPPGSPARWRPASRPREGSARTSRRRSNDGLFDGLVLRSHRAAVLVVDDSREYEGDPGTSFGMPFNLSLSCDYGELVSVEYVTSPGTATEGVDYAYTIGGTQIPSGSTAVVVPVTVYGDDEDEGHETYQLHLDDQLPPRVVLQDPSGRGTITNDDFCTKLADFWQRHPELWPVYSLAIGGVQYDEQGILHLLGYGGNNGPSRLAKQLAATKLNLARGSRPDILETVVVADELLTHYPPGSDLPSGIDSSAENLEAALRQYNERGCP